MSACCKSSSHFINAMIFYLENKVVLMYYAMICGTLFGRSSWCNLVHHVVHSYDTMQSVVWNIADSKVVICILKHYWKKGLNMKYVVYKWKEQLLTALQESSSGDSSLGTPTVKTSPGWDMHQPPMTKLCIKLLKANSFPVFGTWQPRLALLNAPFERARIQQQTALIPPPHCKYGTNFWLAFHNLLSWSDQLASLAPFQAVSRIILKMIWCQFFYAAVLYAELY